MKDIYYHLINSAIAGGLVMLGAFSTILAGDPTTKEIIIGFLLGVLAGATIFLTKFNDWFKTQDNCQKLFNFI